MKEESHERALELIDKMQVESLTAAEREELAAHLESCVQCQKQERQTELALRQLQEGATTALTPGARPKGVREAREWQQR